MFALEGILPSIRETRLFLINGYALLAIIWIASIKFYSDDDPLEKILDAFDLINSIHIAVSAVLAILLGSLYGYIWESFGLRPFDDRSLNNIHKKMFVEAQFRLQISILIATIVILLGLDDELAAYELNVLLLLLLFAVFFAIHGRSLWNKALRKSIALNQNSADLSDAYLKEANCKTVDFTGANLAGANLAYADLTGANLTDTDLTGANLNGVQLKRITDGLTVAHLQKMKSCNDANLAGAILTGAILTGANLAGANLTGANLTGANLTGANLTGANLTGANLTGAILTGANLNLSDKDFKASAAFAFKRPNDLILLIPILPILIFIVYSEPTDKFWPLFFTCLSLTMFFFGIHPSVNLDEPPLFTKEHLTNVHLSKEDSDAMQKVALHTFFLLISFPFAIFSAIFSYKFYSDPLIKTIFFFNILMAITSCMRSVKHYCFRKGKLKNAITKETIWPEGFTLPKP